jgi:uncharacterized protein YcbX
MLATVGNLWRHPIKGHGVEAVPATVLAAGATMPWDRVWAIAHEAARVDPAAHAWAPCANFSRGAKSAALMAIRARVDEAAGTVTLNHPHRDPITVDPDRPDDAERLIAWVRPLADPGRARPAFVVRANGRGMTDSDFPSVSLLNRASLKALSARIGRPLAMERFRGNVWLDGLAPWEEFDLVGRDLRVGAAILRVREPITRCKATTVDPATGVSDADTLGTLQAGWGHQDFGVYAEVIEGGRVGLGDSAEPLS